VLLDTVRVRAMCDSVATAVKAHLPAQAAARAVAIAERTAAIVERTAASAGGLISAKNIMPAAAAAATAIGAVAGAGGSAHGGGSSSGGGGGSGGGAVRDAWDGVSMSSLTTWQAQVVVPPAKCRYGVQEQNNQSLSCNLTSPHVFS
jgi:hypothetical protein